MNDTHTHQSFLSPNRPDIRDIPMLIKYSHPERRKDLAE